MGHDGEGTPDPFAGIPFLGDMARAMSGQGPLNWELAVQFAALGAVGEEPDPEPEPRVRLAWESLADVAAMRVAEVSGIHVPVRPEVVTVSRAGWARRTLADLRPLFTAMAAAIADRPATGDDDERNDPMGPMFAALSRMMAPALTGMSIGSMVGSLARHALGQYELPIPRPGTRDLLVVSSSVDAFGAEWDITVDDLRMWVLVHELSSHAVLSAPALSSALGALLTEHVSAFSPDPAAILDRLGGEDPGSPDALASLQSLFSDPMVLMGALRSPEQERIAPRLDAAVSAVAGYIDHLVDEASRRVLGNPARIAEAARRRRVEWGDDARLIENILGVSSTREGQRRGRDFIAGVVERDGARHLHLIADDPVGLPTPAEMEAPGLWLARLGVAD